MSSQQSSLLPVNRQFVADDPADGRTSMSDEPSTRPTERSRHASGGRMNTSGPSGKTAASSIVSSATIGPWGVEMQVYREREFLYGRRWATREPALEEVDEQKARYFREGGVLI
jgi:hypothetical protein